MMVHGRTETLYLHILNLLPLFIDRKALHVQSALCYTASFEIEMYQRTHTLTNTHTQRMRAINTDACLLNYR